jgi:protein-S-isoprenylcysteine O-methyltransferase Ste14
MKKDSPGIKFPPPLYYILLFIGSIYFEKLVPVENGFFHSSIVKIVGLIFFGISLVFVVPSLVQFIRTKNTVVTILPASSLQISGIYKVTRNPMYLGLLIAYAGITCLKGNWWSASFLLILIFIQNRIIIKEEKYLEREFGQQYIDYKKKVRRWL